MASTPINPLVEAAIILALFIGLALVAYRWVLPFLVELFYRVVYGVA
jgi:hypothetical protein